LDNEIDLFAILNGRVENSNNLAVEQRLNNRDRLPHNCGRKCKKNQRREVSHSATVAWDEHRSKSSSAREKRIGPVRRAGV